jgi:hypothetical protein
MAGIAAGIGPAMAEAPAALDQDNFGTRRRKSQDMQG